MNQMLRRLVERVRRIFADFFGDSPTPPVNPNPPAPDPSGTPPSRQADPNQFNAQQRQVLLDEKKKLEKNKPLVYLITAGVYAVILVIAFGVLLATRKSDAQGNLLWSWDFFNVGWLLIGFVLFHLIESFRTVGPENVGAVLIFDKPLYEVSSGLVFVPWLVGSLWEETSNMVQKQIPAEPEYIKRSNDDNVQEYYVDPNTGKTLEKVQPIRVPTGDKQSVLAIVGRQIPVYDSDSEELKREKLAKQQMYDDIKSRIEASPNDPLHNRLTLEPTGAYIFKILSLVRFIKNLGSLDEGHQQLRDLAEQLLREEFSFRTPALILQDFPQISQRITHEMRKLIGEKFDPENPGAVSEDAWGITILEFRLVASDLTKRVNESIANATAAEFEKRQRETIAAAVRVELSEEGKGKASARREMGYAEADAVGELAAELDTPAGERAAALATARETLREADYMITTQDSLAGMVPGLAQAFQRTQQRQQERQQGGQEGQPQSREERQEARNERRENRQSGQGGRNRRDQGRRGQNQGGGRRNQQQQPAGGQQNPPAAEPQPPAGGEQQPPAPPAGNETTNPPAPEPANPQPTPNPAPPAPGASADPTAQ